MSSSSSSYFDLLNESTCEGSCLISINNSDGKELPNFLVSDAKGKDPTYTDIIDDTIALFTNQGTEVLCKPFTTCSVKEVGCSAALPIDSRISIDPESPFKVKMRNNKIRYKIIESGTGNTFDQHS